MACGTHNCPMSKLLAMVKRVSAERRSKDRGKGTNENGSDKQ